MMGNLSTLLAELGDEWPRCAPKLTDEVAIGVYLSQALYNLQTAADAESLRLLANAAMAQAFGEVDLIIAATNPGPAFPAESTTSNADDDLIDWARSNPIARGVFRSALMGTRLVSSFFPKLPSNLLEYFSGKFPDMVNMGALTIISNIYGNPAVSIPEAWSTACRWACRCWPATTADDLLFDVALAVERERPWPMVAPRVAPATASA